MKLLRNHKIIAFLMICTLATITLISPYVKKVPSPAVDCGIQHRDAPLNTILNHSKENKTELSQQNYSNEQWIALTAKSNLFSDHARHQNIDANVEEFAFFMLSNAFPKLHSPPSLERPPQLFFFSR